MQRIRNVALVGLGLILIAGAAFASPAASAPAAPSSDAQDLLARTNQLRATQGVPALQIDPEAQALAEQWSQYMASTGQLVHPPDQYAGISTPVYWVGDDIARSLSLNGVWDQFINSPVHYGNLVDPRYDFVGIGVTIAADGSYWVQIKFMATTASLRQQEEPPVASDDPVTDTPTDSVAVDPAPDVQVLGETLTKGVNMAVIPPIRYGAIGLPPAAAVQSSSSPLLGIVIAVGIGLLLLLVAALILESRRRAKRASTSG